MIPALQQFIASGGQTTAAQCEGAVRNFALMAFETGGTTGCAPGAADI